MNAAARMASEYDPANPDENVEYYQAKLAELYEKFRPSPNGRACSRPGSKTNGDRVQLELFPIATEPESKTGSEPEESLATPAIDRYWRLRGGKKMADDKAQLDWDKIKKFSPQVSNDDLAPRCWER